MKKIVVVALVVLMFSGTAAAACKGSDLKGKKFTLISHSSSAADVKGYDAPVVVQSVITSCEIKILKTGHIKPNAACYNTQNEQVTYIDQGKLTVTKGCLVTGYATTYDVQYGGYTTIDITWGRMSRDKNNVNLIGRANTTMILPNGKQKPAKIDYEAELIRL